MPPTRSDRNNRPRPPLINRLNDSRLGLNRHAAVAPRQRGRRANRIEIQASSPDAADVFLRRPEQSSKPTRFFLFRKGSGRDFPNRITPLGTRIGTSGRAAVAAGAAHVVSVRRSDEFQSPSMAEPRCELFAFRGIPWPFARRAARLPLGSAAERSPRGFRISLALHNAHAFDRAAGSRLRSACPPIL